MIIRFVFAVSVFTMIQPHLNPHGPIHESYAVSCLEELVVKQFKYINSKGLQCNECVSVQLLTIMATSNMTSPGFEIQQSLIKRLNTLLDRNIEVINDERNNFGVELYTSFCLIIADSAETFNRKLDVYINLDSYNPEALFLVYFSKIDMNYDAIASFILETLWNNSINNALVLIPKNLRHFLLYHMMFDMRPLHQCLNSAGYLVVNSCIDGKMKYNKKHYEEKVGKKFNNCTIDVVANKIDPFVINETDGFEISFIKFVGKALNIFFNITLTGQDSWGKKNEDGRWTNGLQRVYEDSCVGIGNFYPAPEYERDFDYTFPHFISDLSFVVPIAQNVPKWRVLTVIFSWYVWLLCFSFFVICAILLKITSFSKNENQYYKKFGNDFIVAFQLIMSASVPKQPITDLSRLIFISLAIFTIINSSVYTSSLIKFLTRPQKEPQVDTIEGVFEKGWDIGGLPVYEDIFNVTYDEKSMRILKRFQVNESLEGWLTSVADDRDTCTIGNKFFLLYMLAKSSPLVTDMGIPKIYIFDEKVFSYSVVTVVNKGFPFLDRINNVIGVMTTFGLVEAMARKYIYALGKAKATMEQDVFVQALSLKHLEGAFDILVIGYVLAIVVFLIEIILSFVRKKIKQHKKIKLKRVTASITALKPSNNHNNCTHNIKMKKIIRKGVIRGFPKT